MKMDISFSNWLKKQKGRDDIIGDLASDSLRDIKRLPNNKKQWKFRVSNTPAEEALKQAIKEYESLPTPTTFS